MAESAVAVTGYPSSGKSQVTEAAEDLGFSTVVMGDVVRTKTAQEWGERLADAKNGVSDESPSDVYGEFATYARDEYGQGIMANWCVERVKAADEPVFLDGMRCIEERQQFEAQGIDIELIFVHAPAALRLQWMKSRDRDGEGEFSAEELLNRDERENSWGLNELIQTAETTIHNCTSESEFQTRVIDVLRNLR